MQVEGVSAEAPAAHLWRRALWPGLLTIEALWALVLLGLGISWVTGLAGQARIDFALDAGERPVLVLHVARLVAWVAPLGGGALLLAGGAAVPGARGHCRRRP